MQNLATTTVIIVLDDGYQFEVVHDRYQAHWTHIVKMVNRHNQRYQEGDESTVMRVFCPWEGELYVPRE